MGHAERERDGDRGVHGVAAALQDSDADIGGVGLGAGNRAAPAGREALEVGRRRGWGRELARRKGRDHHATGQHQGGEHGQFHQRCLPPPILRRDSPSHWNRWSRPPWPAHS
jgi:hypothetical protein